MHLTFPALVAQPPLDAQPASVYRDDMGCSASLSSGDGVQGCVCHLDSTDSADGGYTVADDVAECGQARWPLECFRHTRLSHSRLGHDEGAGWRRLAHTHTGTPPEQPLSRGGHAALEAERVLLSVQLALERRCTRLCTTPPHAAAFAAPPALRCARARR